MCCVQRSNGGLVCGGVATIATMVRGGCCGQLVVWLLLFFVVVVVFRCCCCLWFAG